MPLLSLDGQRLWFTSNRPGGMDGEGRGSVHREDFWFSERSSNGEWSPARLVQAPFNTRNSEGSGSMSADGRLLVFSACDRPGSAGGCDLFIASWTGAGWSAERALSELNGPGWDSHPALSADGELLIFSSNRPGGLGGCDLWISRRDSSLGYVDPVNLGEPINTPGEETGPFLHADGRSLYFSSDGHPGLGGADVFFSHKDVTQSWSVPLNLGPPINTAHPDIGLSLSGSGRTAFFATRREVFPSLDIYEIDISACCPAEPVFLLNGIVRDARSGAALSTLLRLERMNSREEAVGARAHQDGFFAISMPAGEYLLTAESPDHLIAGFMIHAGAEHASGARQDGSWSVDFRPDTLLVFLEPLKSGARQSLDPLQFDFNQSLLKASAIPLLKRMLVMLQEHPTMELELRGHTDDQGGADYNLALSQRRANSVRDWLLQSGVQSFRLIAVGVGNAEPLAKDRSESGRARNRRTEMIVRQPGTSQVPE